MSTTRLTSTSYAILGLLAIRPWSTYELTQQMHRSMRRFWPRAQSKLYEEPKKLAELGWATATRELIGRRQRTRYTATPEGRRALASWLGESGAPPVLESEQLLRVFFAEHGTKVDLLATLEGLRCWAENNLLQDAQIAESYLTGAGPFPGRTAQLVLVGRYLSDFADMTRRWALWATDEVAAWPEDISAAPPSLPTLSDLASRGREGEPEQPSVRPAPTGSEEVRSSRAEGQRVLDSKDPAPAMATVDEAPSPSAKSFGGDRW
jgi:PadR family transcriptional regulator AphA